MDIFHREQLKKKKKTEQNRTIKEDSHNSVGQWNSL